MGCPPSSAPIASASVGIEPVAPSPGGEPPPSTRCRGAAVLTGPRSDRRVATRVPRWGGARARQQADQREKSRAGSRVDAAGRRGHGCSDGRPLNMAHRNARVDGARAPTGRSYATPRANPTPLRTIASRPLEAALSSDWVSTACAPSDEGDLRALPEGDGSLRAPLFQRSVARAIDRCRRPALVLGERRRDPRFDGR